MENILIYSAAAEGGPQVRPFSSTPALGLEGIVSKHREHPYRSGPSKVWIKVKNPSAPGVLRFEDGAQVQIRARGRWDLVGSSHPSDEPPDRKRHRHCCIRFGLDRLMQPLLESHRLAPDHHRGVSRGLTGLSVKLLSGASSLIHLAFEPVRSMLGLYKLEP
jgi:hypothetical protein